MGHNKVLSTLHALCIATKLKLLNSLPFITHLFNHNDDWNAIETLILNVDGTKLMLVNPNNDTENVLLLFIIFKKSNKFRCDVAMKFSPPFQTFPWIESRLLGWDGWRRRWADGWTLNDEWRCITNEWLFCCCFFFLLSSILFLRISARPIIIGTVYFFSSCNLSLSQPALAAHQIHTARYITTLPHSCKVAQDAESGRLCASSGTDLRSSKLASREFAKPRLARNLCTRTSTPAFNTRSC